MKALVLLLVLKVAMTIANDCLHRHYGQGSTVCVCNNKHCDTIPPIQKLDKSTYISYTSNKDGLRFNTYKDDFIHKEGNKEYPHEQDCVDQTAKEKENGKDSNGTKSKDDDKIIIDRRITFQSIIGWGAAFTDSTGINIKSLNKNLQDTLLRSYFADDGLKYNLGRVPIAGTDFSTRGYTYLDTIDDGDYLEDPLLTKFKLADEDYQYKIPLIHKALALRNDLFLMGCAWGAPKWMKENEAYKGMLGYLKKRMYKPWSNYFIKFLDAYKSQNITFWGLSTGNEVFFNMAQMKLPGVLWVPEEMADWIQNYLGPTIRNSPYSDIKILAHDDIRSIMTHTMNTILSSDIKHNYIDGVAIHWYFDTKYNAYMLDEIHQKFPKKFLLYTEACNGFLTNDVLLGSWKRGEMYAENILEDINHWATGWIDWNMALDTKGGPTYINNFVDAPIIVNATSQEFYKQPMYYALGHFSHFIPRDSVRIYSSQCDEEVQIIALKKPDGGVVIVILNKTDQLQRKQILDVTRGEIHLELTPHSITTILYR